MTEKEALVLLTSHVAFGSRRITLLLKYFGSAQAVWDAKPENIYKLGIKEEALKQFVKYRNEIDISKFFKTIDKLSVKVISYTDSEYPGNLAGIEDFPYVLYVRGCLEKKDLNAVAIVGSRKVTAYGKAVTENFTKDLSAYNMTIVSGLAFGVDLEAHKAAIAANGRCIAVLAGGVDQITPRSNEWLGVKIIERRGAIISEYPIGTVPQKQYFPYRNRIISGLSKAVLVVEGTIKSGTLHTVGHAADQGRPVFAVPGRITDQMSEGPNYLIQNGAKLVASAREILEELDIEIKTDNTNFEKIMPEDPVDIRIYELLTQSEMHLDEIARTLGLQVAGISGRLTVMELKGLVKNIGNGVYRKAL